MNESEQTGAPSPFEDRLADTLGDHYLYCIGLRPGVSVTHGVTETSYRLCACSDGRWITGDGVLGRRIHAAAAAQSQTSRVSHGSTI
jgi:hypothetical protein